MYPLDTNICIDAMKDRFPYLSRKLASTPVKDVFVSTVTICELKYGAAKSRWGTKSLKAMREFLIPFTIVPFEREDAEVCGKIRGFLAENGTPIGFYDVMTGAQGVARDFIVVTHNTNEFSRIPNIKLEDWVTMS